jgi:hypothetical protein
VKFKRLDAWSQEGEGFTLELLKGMGYDDVTAELARHLGLASPDLLRLTQQNGFSQQPMRSAVRYRAVSDLARLLSHSNHPTDTLYYEVLDLPLPQLEALKTLKVRRGARGFTGLGGAGRSAGRARGVSMRRLGAGVWARLHVCMCRAGGEAAV